MSLSAVEYRDGAKSSWDWKSEYVERLENGDGLEVFSQASVTPDTTLLLAGPPRIPETGFQELLSPIGLVTDVTFNSDNGLRPMWEMGTTNTYFTRGKTSYQLNIGAMLANKPSLMKILTRQSPQQVESTGSDNAGYPSEPDHVGQFWSNMDTENTAAPFGILMIFKTKGGSQYVSKSSTSDLAYDNSEDADAAYANNADIDASADAFVSAMYLENCNIGNFSFNINSQAASIQENVTIMFDRMLAVDFGVK